MNTTINRRDAVACHRGKEWPPIVRACIAEAGAPAGDLLALARSINRTSWGLNGFPTSGRLPLWRVTNDDGSRVGPRAYYVISDPEGVNGALGESGVFPQALQTALEFVGRG